MSVKINILYLLSFAWQLYFERQSFNYHVYPRTQYTIQTAIEQWFLILAEEKLQQISNKHWLGEPGLISIH